MRPVYLLVRTKKSTPIWRTSFYQRFLNFYAVFLCISYGGKPFLFVIHE